MLLIKAIPLLLLLNVKFATPIDVSTFAECAVEESMTGLFYLLQLILPQVPDPILIGDFSDNLTLSSANGRISLSHIELSDYKKISLTTNTYEESTETYTVGVTFESILKAGLDYDVDVELFELVRLFGTGAISVSVENFQLTLETHLRVTEEKKHKVEDIKLSFDMKDFHFKVTGLNHDDEISAIISQDMTEFLPEFLKTKNAWITDIIKPILIPLLNKIDDVCSV